MKRVLSFVKTTLIGSLFFIVPLLLTIWLISNELSIFRTIMMPIAEKIDVAFIGGQVLAKLIVVLMVVATKDVTSANLDRVQVVKGWVDPTFDASQDAFYYVRVLEIPTPRWMVYDVKFFGTELNEDGPPVVIQERAYSSPILYTPK